MDTLRAYWNALPAYVRTVINVALGAALAAAVTYLGGVVNGEPFDLNLFVAAVLTGIGTAVVRALSPIDTAYGIGSGE
jgi:hypothetical protein